MDAAVIPWAKASVPLLTSDEKEKSLGSCRHKSLPETTCQGMELETNLDIFRMNEELLQLRLGFSAKRRTRNMTLTERFSIDFEGEEKTEQEDPEQVGEDEQKTNLKETIFNIASVMIGAGMLSLPYAFREAGWVAIFVLLLVLGVMMSTAELIGRAMELVTKDLVSLGLPPGARDFGALGLLAFGPKGRTLISLAFALELWLGLESFLVLIGVNIQLCLGLSKATGIVIGGVLGILLLHVSMRVLAYVSVVSLIATASAVAALFASGASLALNRSAAEASPAFDSYHEFWKPSGLALALGLCLFCFAGHPCLPGIYWSMREPKKFDSACRSGFGMAAGFYITVSMAGYFFFGDYVGKSYTVNLGVDLAGNPLPGVALVGIFAALAFVVKLIGAVPLIVMPVFALVENSLGFQSGQRVLGMKREEIGRIAAVVVFIAIAILFENELDKVCAVTGCALTMVTSVIFPCAMYWKIARDRVELGIATQAALFTGILSGVVFGVWGTYQAIAV